MFCMFTLDGHDIYFLRLVLRHLPYTVYRRHQSRLASRACSFTCLSTISFLAIRVFMDWLYERDERFMASVT